MKTRKVFCRSIFVGILLYLAIMWFFVVAFRKLTYRELEKKPGKLEVREQLLLDFVDATSKLGKLITVKREKRLPDAIGIGAEKCGTGALRKMISQHPMVRFAVPPETHFFDTYKYHNGLRVYQNMMPEASSYEIIMEKSPGYFNFGPRRLPSMMRNGVGKAKLFLILCDPVNRTLSDFVQEITMGVVSNNTKFDDTVLELLRSVSAKLGLANTDESIISSISSMTYKEHILTTGLYYYHMLRWLDAYERHDIHIIDGELLISDPGLIIEEFQEFLGIPKLLIREDFEKGPIGFFCLSPPTVVEIEGKKKVVNQPAACAREKYKGRTRLGNSAYSIGKNISKILCNFYAPHNEKLYKLLGRKFNWQCP